MSGEIRHKGKKPQGIEFLKQCYVTHVTMRDAQRYAAVRFGTCKDTINRWLKETSYYAGQ